jgi:hypothetical protein
MTTIKLTDLKPRWTGYITNGKVSVNDQAVYNLYHTKQTKL